ncbi:hypothetical protein ACX1NB_01195 [Mycoplasma sp. HF14]
MNKNDRTLFNIVPHIRNIVAVRLMVDGVEVFADYIQLEESGFAKEKRWSKILKSLTNRQLTDSFNIIIKLFQSCKNKENDKSNEDIVKRLKAVWSLFCYKTFKEKEIRSQWMEKGWEVIEEHAETVKM